MLRKTIALFVAVLFSMATSSVSFAGEKILVIKSGSKSGSSAQRNNIYAEVLTGLGYEVELTTNMNNDLAIEMYKKAKGPVILAWSDSLAGKFDLPFSQKEFVGIEYTELMYVCQIKDGADKSKGIVAIQRNSPSTPVKKMGYKNFVPYESSTKVANAGIAGEVDFVYVAGAGYTKMIELGKTCEEIKGIAQNAFTVAKGDDAEKLRKLYKTIVDSTQMQEWQKKRGLSNSVATFNYSRDYKYLRGQMAIWAGAHQSK